MPLLPRFEIVFCLLLIAASIVNWPGCYRPIVGYDFAAEIAGVAPAFGLLAFIGYATFPFRPSFLSVTPSRAEAFHFHF